MTTEIPKPTPEVHDAVIGVVRAAAIFTEAVEAQLQELKPEGMARVGDLYSRGLAEIVVVVSITPGSYGAQLCADVGTERHVLATVPIRSGAPKH